MRAVSAVSRPLIDLKHVSVAYEGNEVLHGVTTSIRSGDLVGIVGPSGAGKTSLLRAMLGTVKVHDGEVVRADHLKIGYVPQLETVDWSFPVTVRDVVLMAAHRVAPRPWISKKLVARSDELLERLGIAGFSDRHIRALSGGQQQRVFLARALFADPDILLLDEPTSGVDVRTRHEVLHLLDDLNQTGLAVVLTTHDLNGIAAHLPRVMCVNGRLVGEGTPHAVMTPAILEETYGAPMDVLDHMGIPMVVDSLPRLGIA
jgi:ABC-type Mn2+/Zn2+ transport system ATPase subunit